jgi:cyclopropane fatty-acyl-phospholipid synthase-like methyltransferase
MVPQCFDINVATRIRVVGRLAIVRGLFRRAKRARMSAADLDPAAELQLLADATPADVAARPLPINATPSKPVYWNKERIRLNDELFGPGFNLPGGDKEVIRLVTPIGITSAATILLIGGASGGAGRILAAQQGLWVRGYEADADLAALGTKTSKDAKLEKRATSQVWDPKKPEFGKKACHHALLLMPLRGAPTGSFLDAVGTAMKPDGHIVMVDIVAGSSTDPSDPALLHWAALERRLPNLPSEHEITVHLRRLRYDVRVVDDTTERHASLALASWQSLIKNIQQRPTLAQAVVMVEEAERWMVRLRLMQEGKLRLIRWHAIHLGVALPVAKSRKAA